MKKFVLMIAAICIIALVAVTFINRDNIGQPIKKTEVTTPAPVEEPVYKHGVDYEALKGAFEPDTVVATVNGRDVTWDELYYWVCFYAQQVESNMQMYSMYYGQTMTWDDVAIEETNETLAQIALKQAADYAKQIESVLSLEEQYGITEKVDELFNVELEATKKSAIGENVTDEEYEEFLAKSNMSRSQYEKIMRFNIVYKEIFNKLYGENYELADAAKAVKFLEDNGYIAANHILFLTSDMATGEEFDAEKVESAYNRAVELSEELKAIEDHEELVKRFLELKEELDEDTGKVRYPNGYTFQDGEMVEAFYLGALNAEEYEVTDPIQTAYGYHVIIRLPLDPDAGITNQQGKSAKQIVADTEYNEMMNENYRNTEVIMSDAAEGFTLKNYIVE